jgi:hypothetical protein
MSTKLDALTGKAKKSSPIGGGTFNVIAFWLIAIASVLLSHSPGFSWLFAPINIFTTAVHEMGHALVCLATGGSVQGLTIVSDGAGHGGLTFCVGGAPLLYSQSGYLGAAFFGCVLIYLGQFPRLSRILLILMGGLMAFATLFLVPGGLFVPGHFTQAVGSFFWSAIMSFALIYSGAKLKDGTANLLVLFLAVQTALNSLTCIGDLVTLSLGFAGSPVMSDASNMTLMTGIPAPFWSVLWAAISIAMVCFTLWSTYGKKLFFSKS